MSPAAAVTVDGLNASLASAPTVMGMFLARVRGRRRVRMVVGRVRCIVVVICLFGCLGFVGRM